MPATSTLPAAWGQAVILCAANPWSGIKLTDQHMAERLSDHLPVLYVDPPVSRLSGYRNPGLTVPRPPPMIRLLRGG